MAETSLTTGRSVFSQPFRQIASMLISLALVGICIYFAYPSVAPVFLASPYLNGFIGVVFVIGIIACFAQVVQLVRSVRWIEGYSGVESTDEQPPRLLASLEALMRQHDKVLQISTTSSRSILDSVATRIDEARDITRYLSQLLIFLGLIGTFYGLATTVPAVVDTIRSLAPSAEDDAAAIFTRLMTGLESQLGGMGTAFASSLLGLAGSLVVGLLELFATHGQNRFYRELEEWMSSFTSLSFAGAGDSDGAEGAVQHISAQLSALQQLLLGAEQNRASLETRIDELIAAMAMTGTSADNADEQRAGIDRLAESQNRLAESLDKGAAGGIDAESRMRLRSIDVQMLRLLEEVTANRHESMSELKSEVSKLTKALKAAAPKAK